MDNLLEMEMISSNTFSDTGLSNVTLREFLFYGDFENVISIIPMDSEYPVSEYYALHPNKKNIYSGYIKTEFAQSTHSLMIVRIKG